MSFEKFPEKELPKLEDFLALPERIKHPDRNIPEKLGGFLASKEMIKEIGVWNDSWGMRYQSDEKKIYINDPNYPISDSNYAHYYFRLGKDKKTGENIFPKKDEDSIYRFLHELCHAYQDYLIQKESPDNPEDWYNRSIGGHINSTYSKLFNLCFAIRLENDNEKIGLSTWGNVPDYNTIENEINRRLVRAIEDANEMVVMKLWHPDFFEEFLSYVSGELNFSPEQIKKDGYAQISNKEKGKISNLIDLYIEEMKDNINND